MRISISNSWLLKLALFATGLSGIVAEYVLATLATYFLGDSVLQWTMVLSIMLFAMGLGSRLSKFMQQHLLAYFITVEFILSILTGFSALAVYGLAGYSDYTGILIYSLSICIGLCIGLEIPLVTRINSSYEQLRLNISSVMEKDYYGSLLGGVFFAFVGLPFLGLTHTPFVLGLTNFLVAILVFVRFHKLLDKRRVALIVAGLSVGVLLVGGIIYAQPIIRYGEQTKYKDKVVYSKQTRYQKIVVTKWKEDYWLYINGNQQLSTLDEWMYHEPLVHTVMGLYPMAQNVLILGGGDGCAAREVLKYSGVESITLVDLDPEMTRLGQEFLPLVKQNKGALNHEKVTILNTDAFIFLEEVGSSFDIIIIDLPDPKTIELGRLYSEEFYNLCYQKLSKNGLIITQAGSPYYATRAFRCIDVTMQAAGFNTVPIHNQVLTLGEWGWILGGKFEDRELLTAKLQHLQFNNISTRWINNEAMKLITSFGKDLIEVDTVEVNRIQNPVLYRYYLQGNWDLY